MTEKCTCKEKEIQEHSCPYDEEVNNDSTTRCHCCEYCTYQCMMDI